MVYLLECEVEVSIEVTRKPVELPQSFLLTHVLCHMIFHVFSQQNMHLTKMTYFFVLMTSQPGRHLDYSAEQEQAPQPTLCETLAHEQ